jgi:flagellar P-ring protein precursor FlgI
MESNDLIGFVRAMRSIKTSIAAILPLPPRGKPAALGKGALEIVIAALFLATLQFATVSHAQAQSRIKDIADFEGVRENLLIGYGLVVGLNGTGDTLNNSAFTKQSLIGMLERLGVNTRNDTLKTANVAAVMVTGTLPAFARQGTRIDVSVSALGDAENLTGGTLLVTPMVGADGEVYAVAQGQIAVGGFAAQGAAASITKGVPTSGRIANGAIVERELEFEFASLKSVNISLRNPDFTTARRMANAINSRVKTGEGRPLARPVDPGTIQLLVPDSYPGGPVALITDIEQIRVRPDQVARVVIDEQSGVIVMGENVQISTVAIAQGNLTIRVTETPQVSQPNPFSNTGATQTVDRTSIEVDEGADKKLGVLDTGVDLHQLVNGLNALGVGPRDMITILQTIKAAGALQADIEVM